MPVIGPSGPSGPAGTGPAPGSGGTITPTPFESGPMTFFVVLQNFPEWAIPMTKVIPRIYFDDGTDISSLEIVTSCQHIWHVEAQANGSNQVTLKVIVNVVAEIGASPVPAYLDMDLVFLNERICEEINTNKS